MQKIIVFGATGNIGAYFVDYCINYIDKSQYEIIAVGKRQTGYYTNRNIKYIQVDIRNDLDFNNLPQDDVYAIINLTGLLPAYTEQISPIDYIETNVNGSIRILEYGRRVKMKRVIYSQTWAEQAGYWGKSDVLSPRMPRKLLYTGDHALYSIAKATVSEVMEFYHQEYGIGIFIFRLPNVYMYHPDTFYFVDGKKKIVAYRYIIEQAAQGNPIDLWGDPESFKDILYVKDLCQMMYKSLFVNITHGLYNAGTGIKTTLEEQIRGIIEIFSPKDSISEIIYKPGKESFVSFVMDIDNAKHDLGYEPQYLYKDYLIDYKEEAQKKRFNALWKR